jgi:hypothetical protein
LNLNSLDKINTSQNILRRTYNSAHRVRITVEPCFKGLCAKLI